MATVGEVGSTIGAALGLGCREAAKAGGRFRQGFTDVKKAAGKFVRAYGEGVKNAPAWTITTPPAMIGFGLANVAQKTYNKLMQ